MQIAYQGAGRIRRPLGECVVHAGVSRGAAPATVVRREDWFAAFRALEPASDALLIEPEHYFCDPRGCVPAVAYRDGEPIACALLGFTESVSANSEERTPTLYCLRAVAAEGVSSLIAAAGTMALVPNVRLLSCEAAKGLRQSHSRFNAYLFASAGDPLLAADSIEVEPV